MKAKRYAKCRNYCLSVYVRRVNKLQRGAKETVRRWMKVKLNIKRCKKKNRGERAIYDERCAPKGVPLVSEK